VNKKYFCLIIFFTAFIVRVIYVLTLSPEIFWPDENAFHKIAVGLVNGEGYQSDPYRMNPLLPFSLSVVYEIFGVSLLNARVFYCVLGAATVLFFYLIGERLYGQRVGFIASGILAVYPPHIYLAGVLIVANMLSFGLAVYIFLLIGVKEKSFYWKAVSLGICLGFIALCRPIGLVLLPFSLLLFFILFSGKRKAFIAGMILLLSTSCILFPWTIRNFLVHKNFVLVSDGMGLNLWRGNNELAYGNAGDRHLSLFNQLWNERLNKKDTKAKDVIYKKYKPFSDIIKPLGFAGSFARVDRHFFRAALSNMIKNPIRTIKLFLLKVKTFYDPFTSTLTGFQMSSVLYHGVNLFYGLVLISALVQIVFLPKSINEFFLYLPIFSFTFAYGLFTACTRFRLPIDPFLILLAVRSFVYFFEKKEVVTS